MALRVFFLLTCDKGSVDTAWALQYWPSARDVTSDVINLSGDYKGAYIAEAICPLPVCQDSLWQQQLGSNFINVLRQGGGSSAYVPTTSIMSLTDEIALQIGGEAATGFIEDKREVGVTNTWIQEACALQPGGGVYDHVGILFSNLAYELTLDALSHDGPGKVDRLDKAKVCGEIAIPGLSVSDIIQSQLSLVVALYNILATAQSPGEPPIKSYAQ